MINEEQARWTPGGRAFWAESMAMHVQEDAWHVQGAGWLVLSDRKEYTEEMRLARLLGQGLMDLEDHSKNLVFILSEVSH